ncbi:MAG: alpha/beta hydrolase [Lachnospiraceae bacterium]|nr:alpha/beta hydrolase [Lachnospiraceae bacterium]
MYEPKNIPIRNNSRRKVEIDKQNFDRFGGVREKKKGPSLKKILLLVLILLLIIGAGGSGAFYYKMVIKAYQPQAVAMKVIDDGKQSYGITDHEINGHKYLVFYGKGANNTVHRGLIFYPGAAVDYRSYAPLLDELRETFSVIVVPDMPMNFAWLGQNYADGVMEEYKGMDEWYMAGHSMGGLCAANYIASHKKEFKGLILLASYTTKDLSDSGLKVLSICGDKDGVISRKRMEASKKNLPSDTVFVTMKKANHGQFGSYGQQAGDGVAGISEKKQQTKTAEVIRNFLEPEAAEE